MKRIIVILITTFLFMQTYAHIGGHGTPAKKWKVNETEIIAEFVKFDKQKVYLRDANHRLLSYQFDSFSEVDKNYIISKYSKIKNANKLETHKESISYFTVGLFVVGFLLLVLSVTIYRQKSRKVHLSYGIFGLLAVIVACSDDDSTKPTPTSVLANSIDFMENVFGKFSNVTTSSDDTYLYVSSNGLPNHNMMVGITAWNEQVPIDQPYTGSNSWAIPIQPELADVPMSTQDNFLKGAIAIAVNGIPIFNPLNNRSEDTNLIGELDQWGGHSGRADDYHYHMPPTHLQSVVGDGNPIAYALDGFPVYGETSEELDENLGRLNSDGSYQYHTISTYPYFIAAMRGKVNLDPNTLAPENQILPQAFTKPVRSDLNGVGTAVNITNFQSSSDNNYSMTYTKDSQTYTINYSWDEAGVYTFEFVNPDGTNSTKTYKRQ